MAKWSMNGVRYCMNYLLLIVCRVMVILLQVLALTSSIFPKHSFDVQCHLIMKLYVHIYSFEHDHYILLVSYVSTVDRQSYPIQTLRR